MTRLDTRPYSAWLMTLKLQAHAPYFFFSPSFLSVLTVLFLNCLNKRRSRFKEIKTLLNYTTWSNFSILSSGCALPASPHFIWQGGGGILSDPIPSPPPRSSSRKQWVWTSDRAQKWERRTVPGKVILTRTFQNRVELNLHQRMEELSNNLTPSSTNILTGQSAKLGWQLPLSLILHLKEQGNNQNSLCQACLLTSTLLTTQTLSHRAHTSALCLLVFQSLEWMWTPTQKSLLSRS